MNKVVVYTCITGDYDKLIDPQFIDAGVDYICYTNNNKLTSNVWQIRYVPDYLSVYSNVKQQRYIKINAHVMLPEYDISIWVDGNIIIRGSVMEYMRKFSNFTDFKKVCIQKHPKRKCVYDEARTVINMGKDTKEIVEPQINNYRRDHYPEKNGMVQTGIMIRQHNEPRCKNFMNQWWNEVSLYSHRDQLSFNYVAWRTGSKYTEIDYDIFHSKWFVIDHNHITTIQPVCNPVEESKPIHTEELHKPHIYYSIPFNSDKCIGKYYNEFMDIIPNDNDYACFVDADTIFTTPDYGTLIEEVIKLNPTIDMFTCYTNRVNCKWQIHPDVDVYSNDMSYHMLFGKQIKEHNQTKCTDCTNGQLFSGMFFIIKKSAWNKIGKAKQYGMLGIDNDIHKKIKQHKMKLYRMDGLYVYHWYRNNRPNYKDHLK